MKFKLTKTKSGGFSAWFVLYFFTGLTRNLFLAWTRVSSKSNTRIFLFISNPTQGKGAKFLENKVKRTIGRTFGAVSLRISHFTWQPLNGTFKDFTPDPEKNNIIFIFKCHCDTGYIGRTYQWFHLRRDQHITKSLRNWMANGDNKPNKSPSPIGDHLLINPECSKHYNDDKFSILTQGRNMYHPSVLESLFIETFKPRLCKEKLVYNSSLYRLF